MTNYPRLKPTLQVAQTECGLCCVRTVLAAFGRDTSISELRQLKEPGRDGLGIQQLKQLLIVFGLDAKVFRIHDPRGLAALPYPLIAFWRGSHFVCVESRGKKSSVLMDPSIGRVTVTNEEFDESFAGFVLASSPTEAFTPTRDGVLARWRKPYLWPSGAGRLYVRLALASLLLVLLTLAVPVLTRHVIDTGFGGPTSLMTILAGLGVGAALMAGVLYLRTVFATQLICRFAWHLSSQAFNRLLRLPSRFFNVRAPGEIIYRLNALNRLPDLLGVALVQGVLDLMSGLAVLGYIFWTSPTLGAIIVAILVSLFFFLGWVQPRVSAVTDAELHEGSNAQSIQLDAVVSINSVKLGGYVGTYVRDWENSFRRLLKAMTRRIRLQEGLLGAVVATVQVFAPLALLVLSLAFAAEGIITLGQAVAVQAVASLLFSYARSVFSTWNEAQVAARYVELAEDVFEYPPERSADSAQRMTSGRITALGVDFRYSSESAAAVRGLNVDVIPGETLALVGRSGSGKTTVGKLFASLFEPTQGRLLFDGVDVRDYDLDTLRRSISYIPQEAYLHNRTILENLRLGSGRADDEIIEFCRGLGFLDFVDELGMGYHTTVSELGANLSGGQRQRIHVARVLLQRPAVLIMDEATSSLDNLTQRQVYARLGELDCTKIVIAHRFATIVNADRIAVLDGGDVVQLGSHHELMAVRGAYSDLFNAELGGSFDAATL